MPQVNYYPVYEPDQVLTDTSLNATFAYLDQQDHLTRNKLIGIGIVCGLNTSLQSNTIIITSGVGVTSLGYLLQFGGGTFTHVRPYTLPDFPETIDPAVHAYYAAWSASLLVEASVPKEAGDVLLEASGLLKTHVVVLLLEPQLTDLKNCTTEDCNDKGKRVDITIRPMLVSKEQLNAYKYLNLQTQKYNFPEVHFQRWNVPYKNIQHPANVIQAFDDILDTNLLKQLDDACSFVYGLFHNALGNGIDDSLLLKVYANLVALIQNVRKNNTVYFQYLYDHVDDIIKAYHDFRDIVFDVISECCPDENLFPLHLMLGEASGNSLTSNTPYRNYFIYSPLFNGQKEMYNAARQYYLRLVLLLQEFELPLKQRENNVIKITPSYLGDYPLGKRCIPYYYRPVPLYQYWDYEKTRRGKAQLNYSYFSSAYSSDAKALQPLLYDTEPYNFFRIEGHAGLPVAGVLRELALQKLTYNLPIDVVALNIYPNTFLNEADKLKCYFSDLESHYNVLVAELLCKLHGLYCAAGKWTFNELIFRVIFPSRGAILKKEAIGANLGMFAKADASAKATGTPDNGPDFTEFDNLEFGKTYATTFAASQIKLQLLATSFVDRVRRMDPYVKGTYMRAFCNPGAKDQTVASYYLNWVTANPGKQWPKPQPPDAGDTNLVKWFVTAYLHMFYLIDSTEELLSTVLPYDLNELNYTRFKLAYDVLMEEVEAYADYFDNFYHGLDILNDQKDIAADKPFNLIQEELEAWIIGKVVTKLVADSRILISMCFDDRLHQLQYEYRKRVAYILEQHIFGNYAKLKTGLEHKAGVPKGGTFVLVYYDRPARRDRNELTAVGSLINVVNAEVNIANANADLKAAASEDTLRAAAAKPTDQEKLAKSIQQVEKVIEINKEEFAATELRNIQELFSRLVALPASADILQIPEGVVFADLYIPYMCCSECAPTAFVFADTKEDTPNPDISIKRTFFCNNEDVKEPITIDPATVTVTGQGVLKEGDQYFFNPKGLAEGDYVLQGKLGAKTDTVTVTVKATYDPDFNFTVKGIDPTGGGVIVAFTAVAQSGQHSWDFGDGGTSTEVNPEHVYFLQQPEAVFNVVHSVTNGNCTLPPVTKQVLVQRPNTINLAIKRDTLCTNDNPERLFYEPANGNMTCTEKATAIVTVNGLFHFAPAVSGVGTFTIVYELGGQSKTLTVKVIPAPSADFDFDITFQNSDIITVQFKSKQPAGTHDWKFSDGQTSTEADPLITFKRTDNTISFTAIHTLKGDICSDTITKEIKPAEQPSVVETSMNMCYDPKAVNIEPNLLATGKLVVQDAGGQKLTDRGMLTLNPKLKPGTSKVILKYQVVGGGATVDKVVTVTVNRVNEAIEITFGNGQAVFAAKAASATWTLNAQNSTAIGAPFLKDRNQNPLSLKFGSEIPRAVEIAMIVDVVLVSNDCSVAVHKSIPANDYNSAVANNGTIKL